MSTGFVEVENLAVRYGPVLAVDSVRFHVERGEHVTLLGPSGCGKTTTLRAIAGLEAPSEGWIRIDGTTICDTAAGYSLPPEKRGLSMVFQSYAIWPHMTVFDNVGFGFRVRGVPRNEARPAIERALALVDLASFAGRPATRLSGGQQQRVALARAIAIESKIVLFDEPLSNLDAQLRISMREELSELRRRLGFTAIYVTHDQEEAFAPSDRIILMRGGRIEQQGTPAELHHSPRNRFAASFLGMSNILAAEITKAREADGLAQAQLAGGFVLQARDPCPQEGRGGADAVGFRPIDVRIGVRPTESNIAGAVVRSVFAGDLVHYRIRSGPIEISAYDRPHPELAEGSAVWWQVAPERCLVLRD